MNLPITFSVRTVAACGALIVGLSSLPAQVVLNEVMADNRSAVENGNTFPDYIELHNPSAQPVSLAGMSLTDDPAIPRQFIFPPGTTIPAGGYLLVWADDPSSAPGLHTGFGLGANTDLVRLYGVGGAPLLDEIAYGLQVPNLSLGRVPGGNGQWTLTVPTPRAENEVQPLAPPTQLRINEWMARPSVGDDWIELYNGDPLPAALGGTVMTDSASGVPANRAIPAHSFIAGRGFVLFQASDLEEPDADHLDFRLGAGGETLTLYAANRTTILERVVFGAQTDDVSQGRSPDGSDHIISFPAGRQTPGMPNFSGTTTVVISEVLSHTDPPLEDAIELQNLTDAPVNIGHWWLSDAASQPKKYRIPANTMIPARGFVVFYEYQIRAGANGFTLDSAGGDQVFLSAGDASGNLTGDQTSVEFGPLMNGVSVGRVPTSTGVDFAVMNSRTFGRDNASTLAQFRQGTGLTNSGPRLGPVVISEIMFQPPEVGTQGLDDEFVELHNPGLTAVPLYHPLYPTNRWRIRDGISFNFPSNQSILPGGFLVLVSFDPVADPARLASFRSRFSVPTNVTVLGPFSGRLSDTGENIRMLWPDNPEGPDDPDFGFVPYEMVEQVNYLPRAPWPTGAAGTGQSLHRRPGLNYGNEPLNWLTAAPTPGRAAMSAAPFRIIDFRMNGDRPLLRFESVAGQTYSVQFRPSLGTETWETVMNIDSVTAGEHEVELPMAAGSQGFYRVVTPSGT